MNFTVYCIIYADNQISISIENKKPVRQGKRVL